MLHYLGKSVLLFWPRLPSISKKLHEHANFSFGRKGFCHCVSVRVCVGFDERLDKRYNIWTEGFLSPRHQSSAEIKHHHLLQSLLSSGGTGLSPKHPWRPLLPNFGALESRSELGFPLHNLQRAPSVFFLFPETAEVCPQLLHTLHCA